MNDIENLIKYVEDYSNNFLGSKATLKEMETFEHMYDLLIETLEKQIPKKPVKHNINTTWNYDCECGWRLISKINSEWIAGTKAWFCPKCGQAIDWRNEDE